MALMQVNIKICNNIAHIKDVINDNLICEAEKYCCLKPVNEKEKTHDIYNMSWSKYIPIDAFRQIIEKIYGYPICEGCLLKLYKFQDTEITNTVSDKNSWNYNPDIGGIKCDAGKPRFDLIPVIALFHLAEHYTKGAEKYTPRQWEKGMQYTRLLRAAMSHLLKYSAGENNDVQFKTHHLAAVMWYCCAIMELEQTHPELDDRNKNCGFSKIKENYEKEEKSNEDA